jgi:hypothetical protein
MRITRQQLTDLINEEISSALLERQNRRLLEDVMDPMDAEEGPMSLDSLMDFARAYAELSRDDRRNLDRILDGRGDNVSAEEVEDLQAALGGYHTELDDYLAEVHGAPHEAAGEEDDGTWAAAVRMNR